MCVADRPEPVRRFELRPPVVFKRPYIQSSDIGRSASRVAPAWVGRSYFNRISGVFVVTSTPTRHSVLFIAETGGLLTGKGCCGGIEPLGAIPGAAADFCRQRDEMEQIGLVYRRLESRFRSDGKFLISRVDPRSIVVAWFAVLLDALRYRAGWRATAKAITMWYRSPSLFVDGVCVADGPISDPDNLAAVIADRTESPPKSKSG